MDAVRGRLGKVEPVPAIRGANLVRLVYPDLGTEIIGASEVLAIRLKGKSAPALDIRSSGLGSTSTTIRIGMSREKLEEIVADQDYDYRQIDDPDVNYRFYRGLGLAVRLQEGTVDELALVQVPDRIVVGGI
jgi:hypothetical protein